MPKQVGSKRVAPRAKQTKPSRTASQRGRAPELSPPSVVRLESVGAKAAAPVAIGAKGPHTVIYVHGIGNKPLASVLKCQWDTALFGAPLGDRTRMAYWVNREYYPQPLNETCSATDVVSIDDDEASTRAIMAIAGGRKGDEELALANEIDALTPDPQRRVWLARIAAKMVAQTVATAPASVVAQAEIGASGVRAKIIPLPEFLRRLIAQKLTRAFLRDVNDFLFNKERRDAMEQTLIERISAGGGPFVVIAHSQGSMIAYDVLRQLDRAECQVPLFITIGSPLGMQEVQDALRQWAGDRLPFPPCVDDWVNVADPLDPVAIDKDISNDFEGSIRNFVGLNPDSPRHPHSGTGYLSMPSVRSAVRDALGTAFAQPIAPFIIAKDLASDLEDAHQGQRHETLIQLSGGPSSNSRALEPTQNIAVAVESQIAKMLAATGQEAGAANIQRLRRFVAADLTRLEVETLRSQFKDLQIGGIWRNARKRALISESTHTVQARPANLGYGADGKGICWAVLDTGIRADHPHFQKHQNVAAQWDCTRSGAPIRMDPGAAGFDTLDGNGHGTHVAGIIAGELELKDRGSPVDFNGMAPRCTLYGFKVLDNNGDGRDSWIIKALDTIADLNEGAGQLVIHGVNLSLGGSFDPSIFGTGHTPLCDELRRLWRQGVLVCLAAGNEGYALLAPAEGGQPIQANLALSIGDPANLEEAIAVGSVHKKNPHTYGISYFSSRGPTADGRRKPDVVAPGEKIVSARHDWRPGQPPADVPFFENQYVEMSGTSMAAPHVSGLLAAFLSLRREFIGYPDRVKQLMLDGCVDLKRDPYFQGFGLPNLIKMLALN